MFCGAMCVMCVVRVRALCLGMDARHETRYSGGAIDRVCLCVCVPRRYLQKTMRTTGPALVGLEVAAREDYLYVWRGCAVLHDEVIG